MSTSAPQTASPATAEGVLARVNELVPVLRERARATEQLRRMHPETLRDLTDAGVFKLNVPADRGGYQASDDLVTEVLAQIGRGCPSTSWICALMHACTFWAALVPDEGADELFATPDLRITGLIAPTGTATPVDGGFSVTGEWLWNTGGVHSSWVGLACMTEIDGQPAPIVAIVGSEEVEHDDTWDAAGMAGTATNRIRASEVYVPASRTIFVPDMANGKFPQRRYSDDPYYNRPAVMYFMVLSAPSMVGMARGAMDVFMEKLPNRGITYTDYAKAAEAPIVHHQLARAQFDLEIAEMFMEKLRGLLRDSFGREVPVLDRLRARAWLGECARHSRSCVNQLFEASGASQIQHSAHIQRYFRDANALSLHALVQPTNSDELYGRALVGLSPNSMLF
jgi:alkylation response protein AidB-like acyl-CoA dehydrogenase